MPRADHPEHPGDTRTSQHEQQLSAQKATTRARGGRGTHMYLTIMHDRPTSWPAPSGITSTDAAAAPAAAASSFTVMVPQGCRTQSTGGNFFCSYGSEVSGAAPAGDANARKLLLSLIRLPSHTLPLCYPTTFNLPRAACLTWEHCHCANLMCDVSCRNCQKCAPSWLWPSRWNSWP